MALEKKQCLRKMEVTFTDDKAHPDVHYEFDNCILEDGVEIAKTKHREVKSLEEARDLLGRSQKYVHAPESPI